MSMCNVLVGPNVFEEFGLAIIGKDSDDFPRYRGCVLSGYDEDDDKNLDYICVETRSGGGNREEYEEDIEAVTEYKHFSHERDWISDNTYMSFYFHIPEEHKDDIKLIIAKKYTQISDSLKEKLPEDMYGMPRAGFLRLIQDYHDEKALCYKCNGSKETKTQGICRLCSQLLCGACVKLSECCQSKFCSDCLESKDRLETCHVCSEQECKFCHKQGCGVCYKAGTCVKVHGSVKCSTYTLCPKCAIDHKCKPYEYRY